MQLKYTSTSFCILIFIFSFLSSAFAGSIQFTWNPNTEPDLKGYYLYYGTTSRVYGPPVDVGNATTYRLEGLENDTVYYLSLTAVDNLGNESGFTPELQIETGSPGITLTADAYKVKGDKFADLAWSGISSDRIDIYRDGVLIPEATGIPNEAAYLHGPFNSGKPATYRVCSAGSSTCSNEITLSW
jgi:hypothetical protein